MTVLYEPIIEDPLFLKTGFIEEYRTDKIIMLKKDLKVFSDEIHG